MHKDLQYTVLEKNFASFYTISGEAYGIQFIENTQIDFESLLNFSLDTTPIEKAVYETKILYCITYCSVKKDQDFVRGANIMGIAAGTYSKHFNSLKPVLARVLDELFCNRQNIRKTIRKIFTSINAAPWPNLQITESEKKVWKWCSDRGYSKNNLNSCVQINYSNPVYLELDITLLEDEIISVSLLRLFEIFRGDLMKIYNGVMQEKRVVVFSQEKNCEFIGNMACAVARLVSPPLPYVASLHLSPFIHLNSLDVLNSSFFIAGANNPLFKIRTQWWDVLADLDTGAVVSSIVLPNVHKDFIENLDSILQQESHKELCIRSQFYDYTQHIIECSLNSEEFENFECKINSEKCGNLALQYCLIKQNALGTKKNDLKIKLLKLRLSHMKSVTFQIDEIYKEIYKGLKGKTECFELLGLMPNSGDLHCIAWAFFTENTTAWKYACKILTRLEEVPEGEFLVTSLPTSELNAYLAYKHRQ